MNFAFGFKMDRHAAWKRLSLLALVALLAPPPHSRPPPWGRPPPSDGTREVGAPTRCRWHPGRGGSQVGA